MCLKVWPVLLLGVVCVGGCRSAAPLLPSSAGPDSEGEDFFSDTGEEPIVDQESLVFPEKEEFHPIEQPFLPAEESEDQAALSAESATPKEPENLEKSEEPEEPQGLEEPEELSQKEEGEEKEEKSSPVEEKSSPPDLEEPRVPSQEQRQKEVPPESSSKESAPLSKPPEGFFSLPYRAWKEPSPPLAEQNATPSTEESLSSPDSDSLAQKPPPSEPVVPSQGSLPPQADSPPARETLPSSSVVPPQRFLPSQPIAPPPPEEEPLSPQSVSPVQESPPSQSPTFSRGSPPEEVLLDISETPGSLVEFSLPGREWVYLGSVDGYNTPIFQSRDLQEKGTQFRFIFKEKGDYRLRFLSQGADGEGQKKGVVRVTIREKETAFLPPTLSEGEIDLAEEPSPQERELELQKRIEQAMLDSDFAAIQRELAKLLQSDPPETVLLELARLFSERRAYGESAIKVLESLLRRFSEGENLAEIYFRLAEELRRNTPYRDLNRAKRLYRTVKQEFPLSPYSPQANVRLEELERHFFRIY